MRIAITAKGKDLDSDVDERFGRCETFIIVDKDLNMIKTIDNAATGSMEGAGIKAATKLTESDVDVLLTGNVGPNAFRSLEAAGISVYTGASGKVKETLKRYTDGDLKKTDRPTSVVHGHV